MMATTIPDPQTLQQQQQQLHRISTCERHPDQQFTGFCASCLRERLAGLDPATRRLKSSSSSSYGASAALKSIFFRHPNNNHQHASSSSSSFPSELRRCKSFSGGRGDGYYGPAAASSFEPQRKSCDVRVRNTLWSLFHLDDKGTRDPSLFPPPSSAAAAVAASTAAGGGEIEIECLNLGFATGVAVPVLESRDEEEEEEEEEEAEEIEEQEEEEEEEEKEGEEEKDNVEVEVEEEGGRDEIRPVHPVLSEEAKEIGEEEELKTMKDHIDLDSHTKKPPPKDLKEIAGSFWLAASVFSKKLQKWRRKQKLKKHNGGGKTSAAAMRAEKPSKSRRFRETQSEVAEDIFGRRSCDTDPRFSLDAGRISFDDPRYSWDEPRASWDGYLIGGRSVFPRVPPMLSVLEDAPVAIPAVQRSDGQIPVEEDSTTPGGSAQTRDYYSDSSSRRRRSLDRSSSVRRSSVEIDEPKPVSNAKVSPTVMATEYFHHVNKFERDFRDSNSNSLREDCSESFDSAYRDPVKGGPPKKSRLWSKAWNLWGFIHRRGHSRGVRANGMERSLSESWPELRREANNGKVFRSNSNVSLRHSINSNGGFGSMRSGQEINGHAKKKREEFVLDRSRSARYSPSHIDNGLLRFYLTPMRSSRRSNGSGKGQNKSSHSFTRSVLRLY